MQEIYIDTFLMLCVEHCCDLKGTYTYICQLYIKNPGDHIIIPTIGEDIL